MMKKKETSYIHAINRDWCKACGICIHFCPRQVYTADKAGKPEARQADKCIGCRLCEFQCPDLAIKVVPQEVASS